MSKETYTYPKKSFKKNYLLFSGSVNKYQKQPVKKSDLRAVIPVLQLARRRLLPCLHLLAFALSHNSLNIQGPWYRIAKISLTFVVQSTSSHELAFENGKHLSRK